MILQPEPESRLVTRTTLAPLARHWSAWEIIRWASPSAFTTVAETPAFLKAALNVGLSCVCQRTDDFVSGSRTQAFASADDLLDPASAAVAATLMAARATTSMMTIFFTILLLVITST